MDLKAPRNDAFALFRKCRQHADLHLLPLDHGTGRLELYEVPIRCR